MLLSAVQWSESVICIHWSLPLELPTHSAHSTLSRSSQSPELSFLCFITAFHLLFFTPGILYASIPTHDDWQNSVPCSFKTKVLASLKPSVSHSPAWTLEVPTVPCHVALSQVLLPCGSLFLQSKQETLWLLILLKTLPEKVTLSSVQFLSCVWLYVTPWAAARQASLSITSSWSPPKPMSIELVMPSNHLILCHPFSSCPQSFPASGSFPMSQHFASDGQSIGVSTSTSVLPLNTQDWSPLGWTCWISLQSKGLSRVFSNTTVQKHQFFGTQLSL